MNPIVKNIARPFYSGIYYFLHQTLSFNPFFSHRHKGKRIKQGHIRTEQETSPELDALIVKELVAQNIPNTSYTIDISAFKKFTKENKYPGGYYGTAQKREWEFIQKSLEHFVSLQFLELSNESVVIDIGACTSPFTTIIKNIFATEFAYKQDLLFKTGINGNEIGGTAGSLPFPDESVDALTLHCSLEHFEGNEDIAFFKEAQRVLKKGGKCVLLPFYLSSEYTIHLDPVMNALKSYAPEIAEDEKAVLRYCDSKQPFTRHYDVQNFKTRILSQLTTLDAEIMYVTNRKDIDPDCYLRFIAVFTKH